MEAMTRAVVTGATSGIGEAIACTLSTGGMTVVMVGRSEQRLNEARQRVRGSVPGADLHLERADLSRLKDVRDLAERLACGPPPDVVISNAATIAQTTDVTPEGLQRTLATNHLAPYLLLRSLIEPLRERPTRFVVVGADPRALARAPVNLNHLDFTDPRSLALLPSLRPFAAYAQTKNMNAMFVYALARRIHDTQITINGAHPGIISGTRLGQDARGVLKLMKAVLGRFTPGPETGADTPTWLATSPAVDGVNGRFFVKRQAVITAPHTTNPARCDQLWDESARLTGLPPAL